MGHAGIINQSVAEIMKHGYLLLFTWVTVEQLGAPVPGMPILIAAGVLSATGELSLGPALFLGILGCLIGDAIWYGIGRCWATKTCPWFWQDFVESTSLFFALSSSALAHEPISQVLS